MRLVHYFASLTMSIAGVGCTSSLSDYQCEVAADCTGEIAGRCEEGGHCSFVDEVCESGYRFGKNSGRDSNECVAETGGVVVDAGPNDRPVAIISDFEMPCRLTSGEFDGTASTAPSGSTLVKFEWQLLGPNEEIVDEFAGPPDSKVWPALHRLGGSFARPILNATTYEGHEGLRVEQSDESEANGVLLYTPVSVDALAKGGNGPTFQLSFALGTSTEPTTAEVVVIDSTDLTIDSRNIAVGSGMQPYVLDLDIQSALNTSPPLYLLFDIAGAGTFWVDNLALVDTTNGDQLIANGSAETTAVPWGFGNGNDTDGPAGRDDLPTDFLEPGRYALRLQVTDSRERVSEYAELEFMVAACP